MEQLSFSNIGAFREWLLQNHHRSQGIWIVFHKKATNEMHRYEDCLIEALCFGWVDSLVKKIDDDQYLRKFTPRRHDSRWSAKNKELATRLIRESRMTEWGLKAVETAKVSGNWEAQYFSAGEADVTLFIKELHPFESASQKFMKLPVSIQKQFATFYFDAKKAETRQKRLMKAVTMIENDQRFI